MREILEQSRALNPYVVAIMISTAFGYIDLLLVGISYEIPWLLAALALFAVYSFKPRG